MLTPPVIEIAGLTKSYPSKPVLRSLDLQVPAGSVVGLIGTNGAGKSTLLKCALGLIRPEEGSITMLGERAWDLSAAAKARLGYVPQENSLYPWMKVRQIVDYVASFYPQWNDALTDRLLGEWQFNLRDRVGILSPGQAQKLAIILAIGHEPELLVLDEPASALDPDARREFLRLVLSLVSEGQRTILFSTHITSDLERVADRVAILRNGKIAFHEELDVLKDRIKRLRIQSDRPLPAAWQVPGTLRRQVNGTSATLSVSQVTPELVGSLRRDLAAQVQVEDLNLEDIFLEVVHAEPH